ncbi:MULTISPECIES: RidA family protein [unclassified Burkholderia]|uniref:RidA family protein n=1 Tax=unclassified Burkholderia TaxID=2613784 RepID=UPI0005CEAD78|nr:MULTISPECIES: RidA family protein [unclassified Burkholderia]TGN98700.1 RidA family protein [Burkholderia sp. USMB20]
MEIQRIVSSAVSEAPSGLWSNCLKVGDLVFLSGLTARGEGNRVIGDDEYVQARAIFERIEHLLAAAGGNPADIVKLNLYLTRIEQREQVWTARREFFERTAPERCFPTATLVEVSALQPDVLVEIEAVACLNAGGRPKEQV